MKKNLFFTFLFSFIPGAGQMYQGYMKRGLSIAIIAFMFIICNIFLNTPIFIIPFLVTMMYSFFDTYNLRNNSSVQDDYLLFNNLVKNRTNIFKNKYVAYALIILGLYILFNNIVFDLLQNSNIELLTEIIYKIKRILPSAVVSIIAIIFGFKFLRKE
ncbi:MAG: hypothetical protein RSE41_11005 [Clostridia bacterium]